MMFMNKWSETIKGPDKLFHNFFEPKLTGTISGSRISRSCVKGNCTKRQLFADFSYLLKYCNWSSGILIVCNLRSLIGFFKELKFSTFVWLKKKMFCVNFLKEQIWLMTILCTSFTTTWTLQNLILHNLPQNWILQTISGLFWQND